MINTGTLTTPELSDFNNESTFTTSNPDELVAVFKACESITFCKSADGVGCGTTKSFLLQPTNNKTANKKYLLLNLRIL